MNVCPICEASLEPPYFVYGKFGPRVYNVSRISLLAKKKKCITAPILKLIYDWKPETFFWAFQKYIDIPGVHSASVQPRRPMHHSAQFQRAAYQESFAKQISLVTSEIFTWNVCISAGSLFYIT